MCYHHHCRTACYGGGPTGPPARQSTMAPGSPAAAAPLADRDGGLRRRQEPGRPARCGSGYVGSKGTAEATTRRRLPKATIGRSGSHTGLGPGLSPAQLPLPCSPMTDSRRSAAPCTPLPLPARVPREPSSGTPQDPYEPRMGPHTTHGPLATRPPTAPTPSWPDAGAKDATGWGDFAPLAVTSGLPSNIATWLSRGSADACRLARPTPPARIGRFRSGRPLSVRCADSLFLLLSLVVY